MEKRVNTMLIHQRTAAADKTGLVNHCLVYCSKALSTADLTGPWGVKVQGLNKEQLSPGAFFFFFFFTLSSKTLLLMRTVHLLISILLPPSLPFHKGRGECESKWTLATNPFLPNASPPTPNTHNISILVPAIH